MRRNFGIFIEMIGLGRECAAESDAQPRVLLGELQIRETRLPGAGSLAIISSAALRYIVCGSSERRREITSTLIGRNDQSDADHRQHRTKVQLASQKPKHDDEACERHEQRHDQCPALAHDAERGERRQPDRNRGAIERFARSQQDQEQGHRDKGDKRAQIHGVAGLPRKPSEYPRDGRIGLGIDRRNRGRDGRCQRHQRAGARADGQRQASLRASVRA